MKRKKAVKNKGTWLRPDQAAVVWDEKDGYQVMLPKMEDNTPISSEVLLMCAFLMRIQTDQAYVDGLMLWMENKAGSFKPQEGEDNEEGVEQTSTT